MPKVKLGRDILKEKLRDETREATRDDVRELLRKTGHLLLINRLPTPFQFTYAGTVRTIYDEAMYPREIAFHAMNKSLISYDPISGEHVYRLGIEGDPRAPTTPLPLEYGERKELIDRKNMPAPKDPNTGQPLRTVVAPVPGGGITRALGGAPVSSIDFALHPSG